MLVDVLGVVIEFASNANVDFSRWFISAYPAVASDQLLLVKQLGCPLRSGYPLLVQLGRPLTVPAWISSTRPAWASPHCSSFDIFSICSWFDLLQCVVPAHC
ncbi:hypothetical protein F511_35910 [Dorcoceras hygrometricum]|uniref:Uncharacterized protein n=1 Tax=Dorcoceras hygrometricum TaxID=472368 RepID=A0A2Z7BIS7_9LAMI|nr:hypothetical protein F511_35910 [Dorcoceras hygrometricum]